MGMLAALEKEYPENSNLTIMNTFYQYPVYKDNTKICDDFIVLTYKDNNTQEKKYKIIEKPDYIFYKIKDPKDVPDYNKLFIERDKVEPVTVPFRNLEKNIAELTGNEEFYKMNVMNRDRMANRKLHTHPSIFFSDTHIEDHYRFRFAMTYKNEITSLHKSFFDIEVDGINAVGDFVQMGECPINCVSFMDDVENKVYTFVLRDDNNPLIAEFENKIRKGIINTKVLRKFVQDAVGGYFQAKKYNLLDTKFVINFYDFEIDLVKDIFRTIHKCSPDFVEGWNSSDFDLTYIIERIKELGCDPADVMCDQSWPVKIVKNFVDTRNKNDLPERGDYTFISGLPVFIDQMIQYASRRKAKFGSINSFKLDDIGLKEAKVQKLDYHHITDSVVKLPYLDFETFVKYNIMDVIVQHCIESQTQDLEYIFTKCIVNNTMYRKGHRQTIYLINRMAADWFKQGYVIGNNANRNNPEPPGYAGAIVHDPTHTDETNRMKINGIAIWLVDNLIDFDYKSLYPSIMLEFNIAPNTQIGAVVIPDQVYHDENPYKDPKYTRGGDFLDLMASDSDLELGNRWFGLASFTEMIDDIDEYFGNEFGLYSELVAKNSIILPAKNSVVEPISFIPSTILKPISIDDEMPICNFEQIVRNGGLK